MITRFMNSNGSLNTLPDFNFNQSHSIYLQNSTTLRFAYNPNGGYYRNYYDYCLFGDDTWYLCNRNDNAYIDTQVCQYHTCFNNPEDLSRLQVHNVESDVYFPLLAIFSFFAICYFIYKIILWRFIK